MADLRRNQEKMFDEPENMFQDDTDRELMGQLDREVRSWRPNEGDSIVGVLVDVTEATSEYGSYPLLTLQTSDQQMVGVHCFHTVLRNEINRRLEKGRLNIDDRVGIKFLGTIAASTEGRSDAYMYRVRVKPAIK